jgi:hypothetical protein
LYVLASTKSSPGQANCVRINRAMTPPSRKKKKAVVMYRTPIFLWSVVVTQSSTRDRG